MSILSFELKLLLMEQLWTSGTAGVDATSGTSSCRLTGSTTVECFSSGFDTKDIYRVDSTGRVLESESHQGMNTSTRRAEYRYAAGRLDRILVTVQGRLSHQEEFRDWLGRNR